jgi:hypothetical protein
LGKSAEDSILLDEDDEDQGQVVQRGRSENRGRDEDEEVIVVGDGVEDGVGDEDMDEDGDSEEVEDFGPGEEAVAAWVETHRKLLAERKIQEESLVVMGIGQVQGYVDL